MAINLLTKYHNQLVQRYNEKRILAGKTTDEFEFTSAETIKILTYVSQGTHAYDKTIGNASRFGSFNEAQDRVQTLTLDRDVCYNVAVDKANFVQGGKLKTAEKIVKAQNDEVIVPETDMNTLADWASGKGGATVGTATLALTKANIVGELIKVRTAFKNGRIPNNDRYCVMGATAYALLTDADNFKYMETLSEDAFKEGVTAKCKSFKIIEVPDDYMPTDVNFICWQKKSVIDPMQIATARVIDDSENIDGILCQGRYVYNGFVIKEREKGVFVHKAK